MMLSSSDISAGLRASAFNDSSIGAADALLDEGAELGACPAASIVLNFLMSDWTGSYFIDLNIGISSSRRGKCCTTEVDQRTRKRERKDNEQTRKKTGEP